MRKLLSYCAIGVLVVGLAACTDSVTSSATEQDLQRNADKWEIEQVHKKFHEALTLKDIDLMMSLYSPNATITIGSGLTAAGREEIRQAWLEESEAFKPTNQWISDHPAYKGEITVTGERGTLHFECHFVDYTTSKVIVVMAADADVALIDGQWLITNFVAGATTLTP